jgi:hypothetical protein
VHAQKEKCLPKRSKQKQDVHSAMLRLAIESCTTSSNQGRSHAVRQTRDMNSLVAHTPVQLLKVEAVTVRSPVVDTAPPASPAVEPSIVTSSSTKVVLGCPPTPPPLVSAVCRVYDQSHIRATTLAITDGRLTCRRCHAMLLLAQCARSVHNVVQHS